MICLKLTHAKINLPSQNGNKIKKNDYNSYEFMKLMKICAIDELNI